MSRTTDDMSPLQTLARAQQLYEETVRLHGDVIARHARFLDAQIGAFERLAGVEERQGQQLDILLALAERMEHLFGQVQHTLGTLHQLLHQELQRRPHNGPHTGGGL